MGTVHWAGTQKPADGKCPECGMKLKQHDPEALADWIAAWPARWPATQCPREEVLS
jgi:hypothetical protein